MGNAFHYQNSFDDNLAKEFRQILSLEEAFSPLQIPNLKLWLDASDRQEIELTYSQDGLLGATASGTAGAFIIATSLDLSAVLEVGNRVRVGSAGAVAAASIIGENSYTISAISAAQISVLEPLQSSFTNQPLFRGLVSRWKDKSGGNHHAQQTSQDLMPSWVAKKQNSRDIIRFSGVANNVSDIGDHMFNASLPNYAQGNITLFSTQYQTALNRWAAIISLNYLSNQNPIQTWKIEGDEFGVNIVGTSESGVFVDTNGNNLNNWWVGSFRREGGGAGLNKPITLDMRGAQNLKTTGLQSWSSTVNSGFLIGRHWMGTSIGTFEGFLPEIMLFDRVLTDAELLKLQNYQASKWGFALAPLS
jgi:hypothetical protein